MLDAARQTETENIVCLCMPRAGTVRLTECDGRHGGPKPGLSRMV